MPACMRIRDASLGMTGRGGSTGVGAGVGTVAGGVVTTAAVRWPARIAAGEDDGVLLAVTPAAATWAGAVVGAGVGVAGAAAVALACCCTCAVSRAVARAASVRDCALSAGVGTGAAPAAGACGCTAGVAAGRLLATAGPSPGHSITSLDSLPSRCIRGRNGATDSARSKTTRNVPGTGCPVRTAVTTPCAAGIFRLRMALESGKSTTRRFGPASDRVL